MPKQIFQRQAPIKHNKLGKSGGGPGGAPDWGRKKGPKPPKVPKTPPTDQKPEQK